VGREDQRHRMAERHRVYKIGVAFSWASVFFVAAVVGWKLVV
jgi:hypothetical protein